MVINKFDYATLDREEINGKRHYKLPDGTFVPSVTTILSATKHPEHIKALDGWRAAVGKQKADQITKDAASVGTAMHAILERHVLGNPRPMGSNLVQRIAFPMAQEIISRGISNVTSFWAVEASLWYPGLYAGSCDLVGEWRNVPSIMDYKQTNKPKTDDQVIDYKCQLVAYGLAHNELYKTNINQGVILMCSRKCEFQNWVITGAEWDYFADCWWDRVAQYYNVTLSADS